MYTTSFHRRHISQIAMDVHHNNFRGHHQWFHRGHQKFHRGWTTPNEFPRMPRPKIHRGYQPNPNFPSLHSGYKFQLWMHHLIFNMATTEASSVQEEIFCTVQIPTSESIEKAIKEIWQLDEDTDDDGVAYNCDEEHFKGARDFMIQHEKLFHLYGISKIYPPATLDDVGCLSIPMKRVYMLTYYGAAVSLLISICDYQKKPFTLYQ